MATSRLSTRRVDWRVQVGTSNKAAQGLVIFEASVSYIPDPLAAGGPRTAVPEPVPAVLDAGGYACTPDPANPARAGERGVDLFTTDTLGEDGGHWTWTARPQLRSVNGVQMANAVPAFSFAVPTGTGTLDLATVQKVPASPGLGTEAAVALVARAEKAVQDARNVVSDTAGQAVEQALSDAGLARKTDPGMPTVGAAEETLAAILDADGRETWLGARASDGGPTDWSLKVLTERLGYDRAAFGRDVLFSVTDAAGMMTDLTVRASDGQFPDWVIDRLRPRLGVSSGAHAFKASDRYVRGGELLPILADTKRVAGWGSSSMQGIADALARVLPAGVSYLSGGKGGERASQIAARIGSVPALLTVAGGSIPASGPVRVTASNMDTNNYLKAYDGTLAGVPGRVAWDGSGYTFTRTGTGSALAVSGPVPFLPPTPHRDAVTLLWMGKNDLGEDAQAAARVIDLTNKTYDWLSPFVTRGLVLGHFMNSGHAANTLERSHLAEVNDAYRQRYGDLYLDVQGFLTGPDLWTYTGIRPTAEDLAEQAAGNKPPSVSSDASHLNAAGNAAVARLITERLALLGWL